MSSYRSPKETPEEMVAGLPTNYESVLGKLIIIDKNCDESEEIDILSTSSKDSLENFPRLENLADNFNAEGMDIEVNNSSDTDNEEIICVDVDEENVDNSPEEVENNSKTDDESENRNRSKDAREDDTVRNKKSIDSSDNDDQENEKISQEERRAQYAKKLKAIHEEHLKKEAKIMSSRAKTPFTKRERLVIIYYLIANNRISGAKGRDIWVNFIEEGYLPYRTSKSVWNHVMQSLIPQIETFKLPKTIERMFQNLRNIRKRR